MLGVSRLAFIVASLVWLMPPAVSAADGAGAQTSGEIVRAPGKLFAIVRATPGAPSRLVVRDGSALDRVLFDPSGSPGAATGLEPLAHLLPSADGRRVAFTLGSGLRARTLVIETATGTLLADDLARTPAGATAWSLDGTTLFVCRDPSPAARGDVATGSCTVVAHRLGMQGADEPLFGHDVDPNVSIAATDVPSLVIPAGSNDAVGVVARPGDPALRLYVAPVAAVLSGGQAPWREAVAETEAVSAFDIDGDTAYLLSSNDAPNGKILTLDLSDPTASATTLVATGSDRIEALGVAQDGLYFVASRAGTSVLRRCAFAAESGPAPPRPIALPAGTRVRALRTDARFPGALITLTSSGEPPRSELVDADGTLRPLNFADR